VSTGPGVRPGVRPGMAAVYGVELRKLLGQGRVRATAAVCLLGPLLFAIVLSAQQALPRDAPFGRYAHDSGAAVSLVVLGFAGQWLLPVLTGVVAGEIVSGERDTGTWDLIATRGWGRPGWCSARPPPPPPGRCCSWPCSRSRPPSGGS